MKKIILNSEEYCDDDESVTYDTDQSDEEETELDLLNRDDRNQGRTSLKMVISSIDDIP